MNNQSNNFEKADIHNFTNDLISDFISTLSIKQFIQDISHVLNNAASTIFQSTIANSVYIFSLEAEKINIEATSDNEIDNGFIQISNTLHNSLFDNLLISSEPINVTIDQDIYLISYIFSYSTPTHLIIALKNPDISLQSSLSTLKLISSLLAKFLTFATDSDQTKQLSRKYNDKGLINLEVLRHLLYLNISNARRSSVNGSLVKFYFSPLLASHFNSVINHVLTIKRHSESVCHYSNSSFTFLIPQIGNENEIDNFVSRVFSSIDEICNTQHLKIDNLDYARLDFNDDTKDFSDYIDFVTE